MNKQSHGELTAGNFGGQAREYLTSATHSTGSDLEKLKGILKERPGASLLDLGCGGGHVSYAAAPLVKSVTACDLSEQMLAVVEGEAEKLGHGNITTRKARAEELPFPDQSFDIVASRYSAHHWHDVGLAMREAFRVLARGGTLVVMDVASPGQVLLDVHLQTLELLRDNSHVRDYSFAEWLSFVSAVGFVNVETSASRLRLEFTSWVTRMKTDSRFTEAIRQLQKKAPREVADHYQFEQDGSFSVDLVFLTANKAR